MPQISKEQIADILESIAQMLELKGELVFKVRAYTNAARALEGFSGDLSKAVAEQQLNEIPGIGKAIAEKIGLLVTTGKLDYYENLRAEFPPGVFEMFELQGLGPKKIKAVWEKLGVITVGDLETASRMDASLRWQVLEKRPRRTFSRPSKRERNNQVVQAGRYRGRCRIFARRFAPASEVNRVSVCGSYRRRKEIVG
jgi:DNA polymerase (family 10)